jgi:hypothetical protein
MPNNTDAHRSDTAPIFVKYVVTGNASPTWSVFVDQWVMPAPYRARVASSPEPEASSIERARARYRAVLQGLPQGKRRGDVSLLVGELDESEARIIEAETLRR